MKDNFKMSRVFKIKKIIYKQMLFYKDWMNIGNQGIIRKLN